MPRRTLFPRYGAAHGHAQEPTPASAVEFGGESVRKNRPRFRGQTLLVPRHGGGGDKNMGMNCS